MNILLTGGAGYIGSHTVVELLNAGHQILVLDNLCNSSQESLTRVARIAGRSPEFVEGDVRDLALVTATLRHFKAEAVVHFAGLKAVGESVAQPLRYYENNVQGALVLVRAMQACGVRTLVFSSSATVYGDPKYLPYDEAHPLAATNPYGASKLMVETILRDVYAADASWRIGILRYFNPVGAHVSGLIGEDPQGIPNNLMPFIAQVAVGLRERLQIFGADYTTLDGTGVRDYIHVVDLALGHLAALEYLQHTGGLLTVNLGTGVGYSVLDMVKAFETASGQIIPYIFTERRAGDLPAYYANPALAHELLGWQAQRGVQEMCEDTWRWQRGNPRGYNT